MKIRDIMTRKLVTVEPDDTLKLARDIFNYTGFHHLLVQEDGKLRGLVSDRDLLRAISPHLGTLAETERDLATLNKKVHQIMTRRLVTLPPDATLGDAIASLNRHPISCVPVCSPSGETLGIVTWRDILREIEGHNLLACQGAKP